MHTAHTELGAHGEAISAHRFPPVVFLKTLLLITSHTARAHLYAAAERDLAPGDALVRIVDTVSLEASTLHVPHSPRAEVVAREPPRILPGGVTLLISYVVLPMSALLCDAVRLEGTRTAGMRTVLLVPERCGPRP